MIKHIVFWKLKESVGGRNVYDNALEIKSRLESLNGLIPGLIRLGVGLDFSRGESSADVALYSEFTDRDALDAYQVHPAHLVASKFAGEVRAQRWVVDYEV